MWAEQAVGFSGKIGGHFVNWYPTSSGREYTGDDSGRITGGPAVEWRFARRGSVEIAALYRSIARSGAGGYAFAGWADSDKGSLWEFPVTFKYRIPYKSSGTQPFLLAGPAFAVTSMKVNQYWTDANFQPRTSVSNQRDVLMGFVAGAGIERAIGRLRLTLDGRVTFWSRNDALNYGGGDIEGKPQAAVLFGIGF